MSKHRRYTTPKGERNGIAKLTAKAVSEARRVYVPGQRGKRSKPSIADLANRYGVSYYAMWSALNHYTWGHVG